MKTFKQFLIERDMFAEETFNIRRRKLNVPLLISKKAIFVTYPHGDYGFELDDEEEWSYSLLTYYNYLGGGWQREAIKYLKPKSYKDAEISINSSKPNLGSDELVYDGKYLQILWSAKKLNISEEDLFLSK